MDCEACVRRNAGTVHWHGEGVDEKFLEEIEDGMLYIAMPRKSDRLMVVTVAKLTQALIQQVRLELHGSQT